MSRAAGTRNDNFKTSAFSSTGIIVEPLRCAMRRNNPRFEGNAQGLRLLTQLENYRYAGGLRLTYATLGAFMKYTVDSASANKSAAQAGARKPGYFASEAAIVRDVTWEPAPRFDGAGFGILR